MTRSHSAVSLKWRRFPGFPTVTRAGGISGARLSRSPLAAIQGSSALSLSSVEVIILYFDSEETWASPQENVLSLSFHVESLESLINVFWVIFGVFEIENFKK